MALTALPAEITVFLPFAPDAPPVVTARALVESLQVARAIVGEDLLTSAITVRLPWTQSLWEVTAAHLASSGVPYEISAD